MEYIPGPTLYSLPVDLDKVPIYSLTPSTKERLVRVYRYVKWDVLNLRQIEDFIGTSIEIEACGVLHADLVGQNVILSTASSDYRLILLDFGNARAIIDGEDEWPVKTLIRYERERTCAVLADNFGRKFVDSCIRVILERKRGKVEWEEFVGRMIEASEDWVKPLITEPSPWHY